MRNLIKNICIEVCCFCFFVFLVCLNTVISILQLRNIKKEWNICFVCYQKDRKEIYVG